MGCMFYVEPFLLHVNRDRGQHLLSPHCSGSGPSTGHSQCDYTISPFTCLLLLGSLPTRTPCRSNRRICRLSCGIAITDVDDTANLERKTLRYTPSGNVQTFARKNTSFKTCHDFTIELHVIHPQHTVKTAFALPDTTTHIPTDKN